MFLNRETGRILNLISSYLQKYNLLSIIPCLVQHGHLVIGHWLCFNIKGHSYITFFHVSKHQQIFATNRKAMILMKIVQFSPANIVYGHMKQHCNLFEHFQVFWKDEKIRIAAQKLSLFLVSSLHLRMLFQPIILKEYQFYGRDCIRKNVVGL